MVLGDLISKSLWGSGWRQATSDARMRLAGRSWWGSGLRVCGVAQLRAQSLACGVQGFRIQDSEFKGVGAIIMGYILGIYWDNGKENGNYCLGFRV